MTTPNDRTKAIEAALRRLGAGDGLSSEARAAHLERVHDLAESLGPKTPRRRPPVLAAAAGRAAAVVLAVALIGGGGAAWASRNALPGDALYPVKTATEQVLTTLQVRSDARVEHTLERADRRLSETEALVEAGAPAELIAETIATHRRLLTEAAAAAREREALSDAVDEREDRAARRLEELLDEDLPEQAADQARAALEAIQQRRAGDAPGPPADAPGPPAHAPGPPGPDRDPPRGPPGDRPGPPEDRGASEREDRPGPPEGRGPGRE